MQTRPAYMPKKRAYTPRGRVPELDHVVRAEVIKLIGLEGFKLWTSRGWKFLAVKQTRGWCNWRHRIVVIPLWVINAEGKKAQQIDYMTYYTAHELAHMLLGRPGHGADFMDQFKEVCPEHLWHYELEYKPRNAKAAGIRRQA